MPQLTQEIVNSPAFPSGTGSGLTVREYFAAAALQGLIAAAQKVGIDKDAAATWALEFADALLAKLHPQG